MWGSQSWNQWALQPSMFNNVPHDEIDWAALAKQWIQMQHTQTPGDTGPSLPPHHPPPPNSIIHSDEFVGENVPSVPLLKTPLLPDPFRGGMPDMAKTTGTETKPESAFVPREPSGTYWHPDWEASAAGDIDERIWAPPLPEVPAPLLTEKKTFDYGHVHDNPPLTMQTVDYNHVSDQFSYNQMYAPDESYDQYWSQVSAAPNIMPPTFLKKDRVGGSLQSEDDISHLDAAKRKQLPAWIREGLEKMEQERLKRLEKERAEKEKAERLKAKKTLQASSKKGLLGTGGYESSAITMPSKSKFESDSEADDDEEEEEEEAYPKQPDEEIDNLDNKGDSSPIEDTRTEEEKHRELMLKVRRMLTEILLSVTNSEMTIVAREVYQKAQSKAPAHQLASSTALRSIAAGLRGLASYGSHSEASGSEEENENSTSDEELHYRIQDKKRHFAAKERRILAELERAEAEEREKKERKKIHIPGLDLDSDNRQSSKEDFAMIKPKVEIESNPEMEDTDATANNRFQDVRPHSFNLTPPPLSCLPPQSFTNTSQSQSPVLEPSETSITYTKIPHDETHTELTYNSENNLNIDNKIHEDTAKLNYTNKDSRSESEDSSDSGSDSASSTSNSSHSHLSKTKSRNKSKKYSHVDEHSKVVKKGRRSATPDKRYETKKKSSRRGSSDTGSKHGNRRHSKEEKHRSRSKKRNKERYKESDSSSSTDSGASGGHKTKYIKSSDHYHSSDKRRRRSWSYDHQKSYKKSRSPTRERSRSQSPSRSYRHHRSRSGSQGHYHRTSHSIRYQDEGRNSYRMESGRSKKQRRSRSRSASRTPKRYRRKSRSPSSENGSWVKKSKIRSRDR